MLNLNMINLKKLKGHYAQDEDYIKNDTFEPPKPRKIGEPRDIQIDVNHPESLLFLSCLEALLFMMEV